MWGNENTHPNYFIIQETSFYLGLTIDWGYWAIFTIIMENKSILFFWISSLIIYFLNLKGEREIHLLKYSKKIRMKGIWRILQRKGYLLSEKRFGLDYHLSTHLPRWHFSSIPCFYSPLPLFFSHLTLLAPMHFLYLFH